MARQKIGDELRERFAWSGGKASLYTQLGRLVRAGWIVEYGDQLRIARVGFEVVRQMAEIIRKVSVPASIEGLPEGERKERVQRVQRKPTARELRSIIRCATPALAAVLTEWINTGTNPCDLINDAERFRTHRGKTWTYSSLWEAFRNAREKAGVSSDVVLAGRGGHAR